MDHGGRAGLSLGVLGRVWAEVDGVPVDLGGPRQRAVLGALIAARGNVVSVDQLVDAVWADDPPAAAVASVQTYVSNLRRALEPEREARQPSRVLVTTPAGYVLRIDPDGVDSWRFETLVAAAMSHDDVDATRAMLEEALTWWGGDPLADLGTVGWIELEVTRLRDVRWAALERLSEALWRTGAFADAEERARTVATEAPLREDAWRLLASTQYAAGRAGDALATLRRARETLIDELGIEPGAGLALLEQQVLRRELHVPSGTTSGDDGDHSAPDQVEPDRVTADAEVLVVGRPSNLRPLIGRDREIAWLSGSVIENRLVTITGTGGTGKTRLALAVGEAAASSFDEVRFVTLQNVGDIAAAWSLLAQESDAGAAADDVQGAVVRALSKQHRLLVLDNLEHLDEMDIVVSKLLDAPLLTILATSRRPLLLAGEHEFALDPLSLPADDSVEAVEASAAGRFLSECARGARSTFALSRDTAAAIAGLCRRLDGLPLALELAAAQLRFFGPAALLAHLDEHLSIDLGRGFTASDRPDRHRTLGATIAYSHELLDDSDQVLFRRLGVFAGAVSLDAIVAVTSTEDTAGTPLATDVLDALIRLNLAGLVRVDSSAEQPRFGMFDTIRDFARHRLAEVEELTTLRMRHLSWCRELAADAWRRFILDDDASGLTVVPAVVDEIRAAVTFGLDGGSERDAPAARDAADTVTSVAIQWLHLGSSAEARSWIDLALSVLPVDDLERRLELRRQRVVIGLYVKSDDPMAGVLELQEIAAIAPAGDDLFATLLHLALGAAWHYAGNEDEALQQHLLSLSVAERAGAIGLRRTGYFNAATSALGAGQVELSLELARTAIESHRASLSTGLAAGLSGTACAACARLGDLAGAAGYLSDALGSMDYGSALDHHESLPVVLDGAIILAVACERAIDGARLSGWYARFLVDAGYADDFDQIDWPAVSTSVRVLAEARRLSPPDMWDRAVRSGGELSETACRELMADIAATALTRQPTQGASRALRTQ